jgi:FAD/FMN-containing dehydrogenase
MGTDLILQLKRGDEGFDEHIAELTFNKLSFNRSPDVVVRPRTEEEVAEIVKTARHDGRKIAVLSGGHSWIGAPVRKSGVLIDMSAFNRIEIDSKARTARIGPAARGGDVTASLAEQGFAYPTGHCGTPGSGGYLLGGGVGLNSGQWKPACFSLRSVRVVTASGEVVVATETENRDLLWLARGAGPIFPGVVTEFELELQSRPTATHVSSWVFPYDKLEAVAKWVGAASPALPPNVEVFTAAAGPERHDHHPSSGYPDFIVSVNATAYVDSLEQAREALAPLAVGPGFTPLAQTDLQPVPFEELSAAFDAEYPEGHRIMADAFWTDLSVEDAMSPLKEAFLRAPSGLSNFVALMPGNGSRLGLSADDAAYSMDERTLVMAYALWVNPSEDDVNRAWMAEMSNLLEPISTGNFISEADLETYPRRLAKSFSPANWERVIALRAAWDPEERFHIPGRGA